MKQNLRLILAACVAVFATIGAKAQAPVPPTSTIVTGTDIYLYNVSTGLFLNADGTYSQALLSATPLKFQLKATSGSKYIIQPQETDLSGNDRSSDECDMKGDFYMNQKKDWGWQFNETSTGSRLYYFSKDDGATWTGVGASNRLAAQASQSADCVWGIVTMTDYAIYVREMFIYNRNQATPASPISYTSSLDFPDCSSATGWTAVDGAGEHNRLKSISDVNAPGKGIGFSNAYIEFWNGTPDPGAAYYTTPSAMPAGFYRLTADVVDKDIDASVTSRSSFFVTDNSVTFESEIATATSKTYYGRLATDGNLSFGWNLSGQKEWLGIDNITLTYIGQPNTIFTTDMGNLNHNVVSGGTCASLMLSDGPYPFNAASDFTATSLTYDRTLTASQPTTVCLPFALTAEEAAEIGTFYTLTSLASETLTFTPAESGIAANTPYLLVPTATGFAASYSGKAIAATPGSLSVAATGCTFVGTLTRELLKSDGSQTLFAYNNGTFVRIGSEKGAYLNPFRAYISIPAGASVKSFNIQFEDNTTAVQEVKSEIENSTSVYDLSGRLIRNPRRGIYIINGKTIMVK